MLAVVIDLLILGVGCIPDSPARLGLLSFEFDLEVIVVRIVLPPFIRINETQFPLILVL